MFSFVNANVDIVAVVVVVAVVPVRHWQHDKTRYDCDLFYFSVSLYPVLQRVYAFGSTSLSYTEGKPRKHRYY